MKRIYYRANKTGFAGVQQNGNGRYSARVSFGKGPMYYIGTYDTAEEANAQYMKARKAGIGFKKKYVGTPGAGGKWVVLEKKVARAG